MVIGENLMDTLEKGEAGGEGDRLINQEVVIIVMKVKKRNFEDIDCLEFLYPFKKKDSLIAKS